LKSPSILAGLVIIVLSLALIFVVPYFSTSKPEMTAEKLSDKPDKFFVVTEIDPILAQAISSLGQSVQFNLGESKVDDLIAQHDTSNIEYQGYYFRISITISEPAESFSLLLFTLTISLIIVLIIFFYLISKQVNEYKTTRKAARQV
jgi:hypothetical protein